MSKQVGKIIFDMPKRHKKIESAAVERLAQEDQLLTARFIRLSELCEGNPKDRFTFKGSTLWTDCDGTTWLRDHWGPLLPVPNVRKHLKG